MSKSSKRELILPTGDSRLTEFIRRARPTILAERGLNERCQIKLKALASDLKMPAELYDLAIEYFQQSGIDPQDDLTRWEREFTRFLEKELKNADGAILSTSIENQLLEQGTSRFQLKPERARQLIQNEARARGMQRISLKAAEENVHALVVEQIGSATYLNEDIRERLFKAGATWGVDVQTVEESIQSTIATNLKTTQKQTTPKRTIVFGIIAIVIGISLFLYARYQRQSVSTTDQNLTSTKAEDENSGDRDSEPIQLNELWTEESAKRMLDARSEMPFVDQYWNLWTSNDRRSKVHLVSELVDNRFTLNDQESLKELLAVLSLLCECEPDDVTTREYAQVVTQHIGVPFNRLPNSVAQIDESFVANEFVFLLWKNIKPDTAVHEQIALGAFAQTGVSTSKEEYLTHASRSLVNQWTDNLLSHGTNDLEFATRMFKSLKKHLQRWAESESLNQKTEEMLLTILESDSARWQLFQTDLVELFNQSQNINLIRWAELFWSTKDENLQGLLTEKLASHIGMDNRLSTEEKKSAIQNYLNNHRMRAVQHQQKRFTSWIQQNDQVTEYLFSLDLPEATPETILKVSRLATQAFALCENREASFDRLLDEPHENFTTLTRNFFATESATELGTVTSPARTTHIETLESAIQQIQDPETSETRRLSALRRIVSVANRFPDISPNQATILANFLLQMKSDEGLVTIRREAGKLSKWLHLKLAVMNLVSDDKISLDQVLTVANALFNRRFSASSRENWRSEMEAAMMESILADLKFSLASQGTDQSINWTVLKRQIDLQYRRRCQLLGAEVEPMESSRLIRRLADHSTEDSITRHWNVIDFTAENELHRTLLDTRVLIDQMALRYKMKQPQIDSRIAVIQTWHRQMADQLNTYDEQFLLNEITLLKLWATACQAK